MIKKILMVVSAVAMSVGTAAAVSVVGSGVASAAPPPATTVTTCNVTGTVNFPKPGLSQGGSLTANATVKTTATLTGSGTGCSSTPIGVTIPSNTTACAQSGGVPTPNPPSNNPQACFGSTTKKGVTTYNIAKDPNYYDTVGDFAANGVNDLAAALTAKPLHTTIDGIVLTLVYGSASQVLPGGVCGANGVGFNTTGNAQVKGVTVATYQNISCITGDSGPGTTGNFVADLGSSTATVAQGTIGAPSALTVTFPNSNCTAGGTVTFAKPGLSANGSLTANSVVKTVASETPTGTGCSGTPIVATIPSNTTPCAQSGGVPTPNPPSSNPPACFASKTSKGVTTYSIAKDPNYYDTVGSFAGSGLSDLQAALQAKPLKTVADGVAVTLVYGSASEVLPGGACGASGVGFDITGNAMVKTAAVATYENLVCLTGDSGTGTTGNFLNDLSSSTAVIATATIGSPSFLTVTFNP